jgi:hypothetical protein
MLQKRDKPLAGLYRSAALAGANACGRFAYASPQIARFAFSATITTKGAMIGSVRAVSILVYLSCVCGFVCPCFV